MPPDEKPSAVRPVGAESGEVRVDLFGGEGVARRDLGLRLLDLRNLLGVSGASSPTPCRPSRIMSATNSSIETPLAVASQPADVQCRRGAFAEAFASNGMPEA